MPEPARPRVLPTESSILPLLATTTDWLNTAERVARIRSDVLALGTEMQRALARAQYESRVRGECLALAMEVLAWYANDVPVGRRANSVLGEISKRLAQLEPKEEAG